ncbi:hypothetical protein K7432_009551 [Basidiobolus ranarum]|uniref:F-box/LRR-repeat protein 15-like leucin rich repeat domain-containing protein n=1 Tax=Basidiobolus ranarum TaxID=34480 RepID=A0ABR2WQ67_9FUNG
MSETMLDISCLPYELVAHTCTFLNRLDLYHCTLINRRWNFCGTPRLYYAPWSQYVASWHKLVDTLHLSTFSETSTFQPNLQNYVQYLDFSELYYVVSDELIGQLSLLCPNITTLIFEIPKNLSDQSIVQLSKSSTKLTTLMLRQCGQVTDFSVLQLLYASPSLRHVELTNASRITDLSILGLIRVADSLEVLHLSISTVTDLPLMELFLHSKKLKKVNLSHCWLITECPILILLEKAKSLEWLDLSFCEKLTDNIFRSLKLLTNLTHLNLAGCRNLSKEMILELRRCLPNLNIIAEIKSPRTTALELLMLS